MALSDPVTPRTRENRIKRRGTHVKEWDLGDLTCPRCGWPATILIKPYYESPWIEHGGFCGYCAQQAAEHFDKKGWPKPPTPPW